MAFLRFFLILGVCLTLTACPLVLETGSDGGVELKPDVRSSDCDGDCIETPVGDPSAQCTSDEQCPQGEKCFEGSCVTCRDDSDCPEGYFCSNGDCYSEHCGMGEICSCDLYESDYDRLQPEQDQIKFTLVNGTGSVLYIRIRDEGIFCPLPFSFPYSCFASECYDSWGGCCCIVDAEGQCGHLCVDPGLCSYCALEPGKRYSERVSMEYLKTYEMVTVNCDGHQEGCFQIGEPLGEGQYFVSACAGTAYNTEGEHCSILDVICVESGFDIPGSYGTEIILEMK